MIRRESACCDGSPGWMLLSQTDHARLAWQLAKHWAEPIGRSQSASEHLLAAILCHDDGWSVWERQPLVDRESGRPIDFTEMKLVEALVIWRRCITSAEQKSHFTAWLVSRHFEELMRHSRWSESDDSQEINNAQEFLDEQATAQQQWFANWQQELSEQNTATVAEAGLVQLQLFDLLSLWFCCVEQQDQLVLDMPSGATLSLTPGAEQRVAVDPWPSETAPFELSITGRVVPQRHYAGADDLAKTPSETAAITWTLLPSGR